MDGPGDAFDELVALIKVLVGVDLGVAVIGDCLEAACVVIGVAASV